MTAAHQHVYLQCTQCRDETLHDLAYAGRLLVDARCTRCGRDTSVAGDTLLRNYLRDLAHRVSTKPQRLARRARNEPVRVLRQLPAAALRQPRKLVAEAKVVVAHYLRSSDDGTKQ